MSRVLTGLEHLITVDQSLLAGRRVGLIANPTSVDGELRHAIDLLQAQPNIELRVLFGPEHGLRGDAQDMVAVGQGHDARSGLPVYSLYGNDEASLSPPAAALEGLDALVFDIQDVGARYYTYVWTMVLAMRACAKAGITMVVLDRPNPIGGLAVEGGDIADGFTSFVGLASVPNRHGLTAGEIAMMMKERESLDLDLHVITMRGWRRAMYFDECGLPWVLPSPNMPTLDTALVYPGMCLIEGTELSEGRGTTRPFEFAGAPYIEAEVLARALADEPGVVARAHVFTPMFQKWAGQACGGVQLHVNDRAAFRPYRTAVAFLCAVRAHWPAHFAWRTKAYEFVADIPAIDLLSGSAALRSGIDAGMSVDELARQWAPAEAAFVEERASWLRYS